MQQLETHVTWFCNERIEGTLPAPSLQKNNMEGQKLY